MPEPGIGRDGDEWSGEDEEGDHIIGCLNEQRWQWNRTKRDEDLTGADETPMEAEQENRNQWHDEVAEHIRRCVGEGWTVGFGTRPRTCGRKILLFIDPGRTPWHQNEEIAAWLHHCLSFERCQLVVLGNPNGTPRIRFAEYWQEYRAGLLSLMPEQAPQSPPVLRIDVLRNPKLSFFLPGGRPAGGTRLFEWYRLATPLERGRLMDAVRLVQRAGFDTYYKGPWARSKYCSFIEGYTHQPAGLNRRPTLSFGSLDGQRNISPWTARIYLHPDGHTGRLPIAIPGQSCRPDALNLMHGGTVQNNELNPYVARDLDDFYRNPRRYFCPSQSCG